MGKGVYWDVIEILRDQNEYRFESDESSLQLLCDLIGCKDEKRFLNWFNDCLRFGLFSVNEGFFVCPPLCENMGNWEIKKANGSKGGRPKKTESKPKLKPNQNLNETIREDKIREEKIIEDNIIKTTSKIKNIDIKIDNGVYSKSCVTDRQWLEILSMQTKISEDATKLFISHFEDHLITMQEQKKNVKDFKNHFVHWIKKQDLSQFRTKVIGKTNQI